MDSTTLNELLTIVAILGFPLLVIYVFHLKRSLAKTTAALEAEREDKEAWKERYDSLHRDFDTYNDILGVTLTSNTRLGVELLEARKELALLRPVTVTAEERHINQTTQPRKLVRLQERIGE